MDVTMIRDISDPMFVKPKALVEIESLYLWNLAFCNISQFAFGKDEKYRAVKMAFFGKLLMSKCSIFADFRLSRW